MTSNGIRAKAYDLLTAPAMRGRSASTVNRRNSAMPMAATSTDKACCWRGGSIEAGSRVACVSWAPDANATWDTHGNNFKSLKDTLLPQLDAAFSTLLDDLDARGMLERTLVGGRGRLRPHAED